MLPQADRDPDALVEAADAGDAVRRLIAGRPELVDKGADAVPHLMSYTPLKSAAASGHLDIVGVLVGAGASLDLQDDMGDTALHSAAIEKRACGGAPAGWPWGRPDHQEQ